MITPFGKFVAGRRLDRKILSPTQLANAAGVAPSTLTRLETRQAVTGSRAEVLDRIARQLGYSGEQHLRLSYLAACVEAMKTDRGSHQDAAILAAELNRMGLRLSSLVPRLAAERQSVVTTRVAMDELSAAKRILTALADQAVLPELCLTAKAVTAFKKHVADAETCLLSPVRMGNAADATTLLSGGLVGADGEVVGTISKIRSETEFLPSLDRYLEQNGFHRTAAEGLLKGIRGDALYANDRGSVLIVEATATVGQNVLAGILDRLAHLSAHPEGVRGAICEAVAPRPEHPLSGGALQFLVVAPEFPAGVIAAIQFVAAPVTLMSVARLDLHGREVYEFRVVAENTPGGTTADTI